MNESDKDRGMQIFFHNSELKYKVWRSNTKCETINSVGSSSSDVFNNNAVEDRIWTIRVTNDRIIIHLNDTKIVDYAFSTYGCAWGGGTYTHVLFWEGDEVSTAYRLSPGMPQFIINFKPRPVNMCCDEQKFPHTRKSELLFDRR